MRNALTFAMRLKLLEWLKERHESLSGRCDAAIAKDATEALGFKVVTSHVQGIRCDDEIPLTWSPSRGKKTGNKPRVSPAEFAVLVAAVEVLFTEYEVAAPAEFTALFKKVTA